MMANSGNNSFSNADISQMLNSVQTAMTHLSNVKVALQASALPYILPDSQVSAITNNMISHSGIPNTPDAGSAHYEIEFMNHKNIVLTRVRNGALAQRILGEIAAHVDLSAETPVVAATVAAPRPGVDQVIS